MLLPILSKALDSDQSWQSLAKNLSDESMRKSIISQLRARKTLQEELKKGLQATQDQRSALLIIESLELKEFQSDLVKLYDSTKDAKILDTLLFLSRAELNPSLKDVLSKRVESMKDAELIVLLNGVDPQSFSLTGPQHSKIVNYSNVDVVQGYLRYLLKYSSKGDFPQEHLIYWKQLLDHPAKSIKFELTADLHSLKGVPEELREKIRKVCEGELDFEMTEACRLWGFK